VKFKPGLWFPIASALTIINAGAVYFAAKEAEPLHALTHAVLAVALALWATRLRRLVNTPRELEAAYQAVEVDVNNLRQELGEAQERLDFAERLLAQEQPRRTEPRP
jgi:C4-dicarboxylate-specific signal transduction histidine kinase